MKLLIALFLIVSPGLLIAQKTYEPIDKIGWELPEISVPKSFTPLDSGTVNYLLSITKSGKIKGVRIISNTFSKEAESKLRAEVKGMSLTKREVKVGYKGTFQISLVTCLDDKNKVSQYR